MATADHRSDPSVAAGPGRAPGTDPGQGTESAPGIESASGTQPAPGTETEPDARYTFANERTFLAWTRTALAFILAGLGIVQLLPPFPGVPWGRHLLGVPLIAIRPVIAVVVHAGGGARRGAGPAGAGAGASGRGHRLHGHHHGGRPAAVGHPEALMAP